MSILFIVSLVSSLSACQFQTVRHSAVKGANDANHFLRALYFDKDPAGALRLADEQLSRSVTADNLRSVVDSLEQERGVLKRLTADSYLMTQGETMELFYVGEYEKGVMYYRLVMLVARR